MSQCRNVDPLIKNLTKHYNYLHYLHVHCTLLAFIRWMLIWDTWNSFTKKKRKTNDKKFSRAAASVTKTKMLSVVAGKQQQQHPPAGRLDLRLQFLHSGLSHGIIVD